MDEHCITHVGTLYATIVTMGTLYTTYVVHTINVKNVVKF